MVVTKSKDFEPTKATLLAQRSKASFVSSGKATKTTIEIRDKLNSLVRRKRIHTTPELDKEYLYFRDELWVSLDELKKLFEEQRELIKKLEKEKQLTWAQADACLSQLIVIEQDIEEGFFAPSKEKDEVN